MSLVPISSPTLATKIAIGAFAASSAILIFDSTEDNESISLINNIAKQTLLSSCASFPLKGGNRKVEILIAGPLIYAGLGATSKLAGHTLQMISPFDLSKISRMLDDTAFSLGGVVSISAICSKLADQLEKTALKPLIGKIKEIGQQPLLQNKTVQIATVWFFNRNGIPPFNFPSLRNTSAIAAVIEGVSAAKKLQKVAAKTLSWEQAIRLILCAWTLYLVCNELFSSDES